jgi:hypothetical protein
MADFVDAVRLDQVPLGTSTVIQLMISSISARFWNTRVTCAPVPLHSCATKVLFINPINAI